MTPLAILLPAPDMPGRLIRNPPLDISQAVVAYSRRLPGARFEPVCREIAQSG